MKGKGHDEGNARKRGSAGGTTSLPRRKPAPASPSQGKGWDERAPAPYPPDSRKTRYMCAYSLNISRAYTGGLTARVGSRWRNSENSV